jgi:hypothetical protein
MIDRAKPDDRICTWCGDICDELVKPHREAQKKASMEGRGTSTCPSASPRTRSTKRSPRIVRVWGETEDAVAAARVAPPPPPGWLCDNLAVVAGQNVS